jgi:predicted nucleic acid-binding protein
MNVYVLDTSVTLAWYRDEDFSEAARVWQRQLMDGKLTLLVPGLHYWEFGNVLRTLVKREEMAESLAAEIYEVHLEAPLDLAEPERSAVFSTALEYQTTTYDAVYIALALSRDLPLITAERTSRQWVSRLGARIEHVS